MKSNLVKKYGVWLLCGVIAIVFATIIGITIYRSNLREIKLDGIVIGYTKDEQLAIELLEEVKASVNEENGNTIQWDVNLIVNHTNSSHRSMGIDIEGYQENREGYYLIDREFELSEIRLLCDAVAASDMIKEETGKKIIRKLINTQSIFQGRMLQKTVFVKSEKKILNKQLFYNIDALNVAINQGCKVSARMMEYGMDNELTEKQDSPIVFSPYVTLWAEGNYYILVKREGGDELEHIRVDLIKDIVILERGIDMIFGGFNPGQYAKEHIFQNGEKKERHEIECSVKLWQDIVDNFGKDAEVMRRDRLNKHDTPSPCIHCKNDVCRGIFLKDYIEERAVEIADYIIENNATVRQTAKQFRISKSTVHKDVTERLLQINPSLAREARKVLDMNKSERHIRGGMATREKYLHQHG